MDNKEMGAPAGREHGSRIFLSNAKAAMLWEALYDIDPQRSQGLFFQSLLRDARASRDRKAKEDEEEERRLAQVFQQWQPAGTTAEPKPTFVLGLPSAPHMAHRKRQAPHK